MQNGKNLKYDHVTILLKCYEFSNTPIGLLKVKLVQGNIKYPGKFYKIYSFLLFIITCVAAKVTIGTYFLQDIANFPFPVYFSQVIYIITIVIGFVVMFIDSFSNTNYRKMISLLMKTTHDLDFDCAKRCQNFKRKLIFIHGFLIMTKIFFFFPDLTKFRTMCSLSAHLMIYINDLETIHFMIETNLIARLFENMNNKLKLFSVKKLSTKNGFLMKMWKTNFISDNDINSSERILIKLLQNCNSLFDIVDNSNHNYTILVSNY